MIFLGVWVVSATVDNFCDFLCKDIVIFWAAMDGAHDLSAEGTKDNVKQAQKSLAEVRPRWQGPQTSSYRCKWKSQNVYCGKDKFSLNMYCYLNLNLLLLS